MADMDELERRINALESTVERLEPQIRQLESEVQTLRPPRGIFRDPFE